MSNKTFEVAIQKVANDIIYSIVAQPSPHIDLQKDEISREEIRKASYGFMTTSQEINDSHTSKILPVSVVENWISKDSGTLGGEPYTTGSWILGLKINESSLLSKVYNGDYNGVSLEGKAERIPNGLSNILKNIEVRRISLVKKGANGQTLQFYKCFDCGCMSKAASDQVQSSSHDWSHVLDSIIESNDSASQAICSIAKSTMDLNPYEDVKDQFRRVVLKTIREHPDLYEQHLRAVMVHEGILPQPA
ncbi:MAG: XkdF-like putative serine protease domain-containing protein [Methanotrichaceae archaeon]